MLNNSFEAHQHAPEQEEQEEDPRKKWIMFFFRQISFLKLDLLPLTHNNRPRFNTCRSVIISIFTIYYLLFFFAQGSLVVGHTLSVFHNYQSLSELKSNNATHWYFSDLFSPRKTTINTTFPIGQFEIQIQLNKALDTLKC